MAIYTVKLNLEGYNLTGKVGSVTNITAKVSLAGPAGADGVVQAILAGTNVTVDNTDPAYPVISTSGGTSSASNGLHIDNGDVKLGGEITELTEILGRGEDVHFLSNPTSDIGVNPVIGFALNGNGSVQMLAINADATAANTLNISPLSTDIFLFSPNGTKYQVTVADDGTLGTTPA